MLRRTAIFITALATFVTLNAVQQSSAADPPKDRVVAMYFHRTERCPTCKKMGSLTEEIVKKQFAEPVKAKTVEFHYVDYQNKKNAKLTKAYKITGPALIVVRVNDGKVAEYQNLKDIWTKISDKKAFTKYVEGNITAYCKKS